MHAVVLLSLFTATTFAARANQPKQWAPLFDGSSLTGWVDGSGKPVAPGKWVAADGVLHLAGQGGGSLYTAKEYGDFELRWEWKIAPKGNSGVKYRMANYAGKGLLGPEYQVYDDGGEPFTKGATASFYDLVAPNKETKKLKPVGEWNSSRIVAKGTHIQHFLNGAKVIDLTIGTPEWTEAVANSKFRDVARFAENPKGPIMLQDHGSEVWFRKIEIREL